MNTANLEHVIANIVRAWPADHLPADQWWKVDAFGRGEIELRTKMPNSKSETLIIRLIFNHESRAVGLTNIFLPLPLRHQGIGIVFIESIRTAANAQDYSLLAVDLVPNFFERLVRRGAKILIPDDRVIITPETDLSHHHG